MSDMNIEGASLTLEKYLTSRLKLTKEQLKKEINKGPEKYKLSIDGESINLMDEVTFTEGLLRVGRHLYLVDIGVFKQLTIQGS